MAEQAAETHTEESFGAPLIDEPKVDEPLVDEPLVDEPLVDEPKVEPASEEGGAGDEGAGGKEAGGDKEPKEREGFIPRDRFDEVNTRAKKVPELEKRLANLQGQVDALKSTPEKEKAGSDFISGMGEKDSEALIDEFEADPKAFLQAYGDALTKRIMTDVSNQGREADFESQITETIEAFAEEHKDFDALWDAGKISKYMDENPGHDAMSSYYALTARSRKEEIDAKLEAAVDAARKDERAKVLKEIETGRASSSLPAGPAAAPGTTGDISPEIKDPAKFGLTRTEALAKSLSRFREGKGG